MEYKANCLSRREKMARGQGAIILTCQQHACGQTWWKKCSADRGRPVASRLCSVRAVCVAVFDPHDHCVGIRLDPRQARLNTLKRVEHQRLWSPTAALTAHYAPAPPTYRRHCDDIDMRTHVPTQGHRQALVSPSNHSDHGTEDQVLGHMLFA